jgi:hypothetical protein
MLQTSPEAPLVFVLVHKLFSLQPLSELKKAALGDQRVTADEFQVSGKCAAATSIKLWNFTFLRGVALYSLDADGIIK